MIRPSDENYRRLPEYINEPVGAAPANAFSIKFLVLDTR